MKFGSVALIGKCSVGKSTFINQVLKVKLSITSHKVQTTRNLISGIYNDDDSQIVIYDTPGIFKSMNLMNEEMFKATKRCLSSSDLILFIINSTDVMNHIDESIIKMIKNTGVPCILVVNKVDLITDEKEFFERLNEYKKLYDFKECVAISALFGTNVDLLIKDIKDMLDEGDPIYDTELFTNQPVRFLVQEYVREKVINLTHEEIPHSITCVVEMWEEKENVTKICASIICEKESQKPILIGKGGHMIKEIGSEARKDIEELLGNKVYLELFVKVREDWRNNKDLLKSYGLYTGKAKDEDE
ncbi:MAG: GTPase Era [Gammaproteobacteria bacterium]|nr:GTPase Era [Gammaproteobacteria bacterium]